MRRAFPPTVLLSALLLPIPGCIGLPSPPTGLEDVVDLRDLAIEGAPDRAPVYLEEGDRAWEHREEPGMAEAARLAYWRAAAADPALHEAYWKAARASTLVGRQTEDRPGRIDAFERGARTAQLGMVLGSDLPEAHYHYAINLGFLARERPMGGKEAVREMIPHLERAAEGSPHVDHGGPFRALALVYLRAPGWPMSVGDDETGLEYARQAVELEPDFPGNRLALAEALAADGQLERAREETLKGRDLAASGPWTDSERQGFLAEAEKLLRSLPNRAR